LNSKQAPDHAKLREPVKFAPLRNRRVFEEICERIRAELNTGRLGPGDRLPPERELARQFGASRTAVREAMRSLENAGIIESKKGMKGGIFIREGDPGKVTEVMQDMIALGRVSLDSLTEARILIHADVVRLAAERATQEDLAALESNIRRSEELTDHGDFVERRRSFADFYMILCRATGNPVLSFVVDALTGVTLSVLLRLKPDPKSATLEFQHALCGSAWKKDPGSGVIGVEKGPLIPVV
jgi:DNA-binding FadR family transcriptional regulator